MTVTIYADTLVFLNTFVTYFLLVSTQFLCRRPTRRLRILAASLVGGAYALTLLFEPIAPLLSFVFRFAVCILLRLIADGFHSLRIFIKGIFVFLLLNGLFAGLMLLCQSFVPQLLFSSGILYLDVSIPFLLLSTITIYGCIRLAALLLSARPSRTHVGTVTIRVAERSVKGKGIFDTGNQLVDGFTGKPVLIVRPAFVRSLLPQGVAEFLDGRELSACDVPDAWRKRLRLFPFSSIGANGMLPAFRCDSVILEHPAGACVKEKLFVAVSPRPLYHGEADALIPALLYDEITEGGKDHDFQNTRRTRSAASSSAAVRFFGSLHKRPADSAASAQKTGGNRSAETTCRGRRNGARSADCAQSASRRLYRKKV